MGKALYSEMALQHTMWHSKERDPAGPQRIKD